MRAVRIRITPELFRDWMPLPYTAQIIGSAERVGEVEIVVTDPSFQEVAEGAAPPLVSPTFRRNVPVEFVKWGL